jgi:hypothetical protein
MQNGRLLKINTYHVDGVLNEFHHLVLPNGFVIFQPG